MDKRLIRILSPITICVFALLDLAVIYFGYEAVSKILLAVTPLTVFFVAVEIGAIIIAVLVTKEILTNGIVFYDDEMEFTGLDSYNTVEYSEVKSVKIIKDNAASLVKNFNDRHTFVFFIFKNGETLSIDLGLTTNKLVKTFASELNSRLEDAEINAEIKTKPEIKSKKHRKDEESTD